MWSGSGSPSRNFRRMVVICAGCICRTGLSLGRSTLWIEKDEGLLCSLTSRRFSRRGRSQDPVFEAKQQHVGFLVSQYGLVSLPPSERRVVAHLEANIYRCRTAGRPSLKQPLGQTRLSFRRLSRCRRRGRRCPQPVLAPLIRFLLQACQRRFLSRYHQFSTHSVLCSRCSGRISNQWIDWPSKFDDIAEGA